MAEKGKTGYVGRLKDDVKKLERIKTELEEKVRKLEEKLKDHDENCQTKIHDLEEEIRRLKEEIKRLVEEIEKMEMKMKMRDLEESNTFLEEEVNEAKTEIGELKTKFGDLHEKIKKFELSEDELVIRQLCSSVQENLSRIVLRENFNEIQNKRTRYMEEYISSQIEGKKEQNEARSRWKKLKKEIKWDEYLLIQLKSVKKRGNDTSHPSLTEKNIDDAKMNLEEKGKLGKHNVKAVDQLKVIWTQTNGKLLQGTSSVGQEQGGPRTVSATTRQNCQDIRPPNGTYASKAAGGPGDCFGPKQVMQSFSRPAFQKRHYSGAS
ncbi:putative golgin subfamily A member 6-like protein 3 isoform X2 [Actinia tenebrosa]|nr:putative golgin subfamily A member 6-like protein 3 isoform X2 [Actinia tenebrosa]